jgi:hypothetical protein
LNRTKLGTSRLTVSPKYVLVRGTDFVESGERSDNINECESDVCLEMRPGEDGQEPAALGH